MLQDVRILLVRPEHGGNVGAAARALKNMGLRELVLVQPGDFDSSEARRLAHGAEDVLDAARRAVSLQDALADCRWSVGTTRRRGRHREPNYTARTFARAARLTAERRPLAIVFGPEKDGLTDADLALCHERLSVPCSEEHPSLNLAQAVLIVAYELYMQAVYTDQTDSDSTSNSVGATGAELDGMYAQLSEVLREIGFVREETATHQMRAFRQLLARARLESEDVALLRGLWRQTLWAARRREP